jgi:subtilisin family serine protease
VVYVLKAHGGHSVPSSARFFLRGAPAPRLNQATTNVGEEQVAWYGEFREGKARDEGNIIVRAFAEHDIEISAVSTDDGWIAYMYADDQFLAREPYLEELRAVLGDRAQVEVIRRVIKDIVLLRVIFSDGAGEGKGSADEGNREKSENSDQTAESNYSITQGEQPPLLRLLDEIDASLGPGIVTLNHVVTTANGSPCGCPATEPQEVYDPKPNPPLCPGPGPDGNGVRIYVADTGIVADTVAGTPWLAGVTGDPDPSVLGTTILPYGGHGTFVAGMIRAMAPSAEIVVRCVFDIAGSALESDFVPKLYEGFGFGAEIFHVTVASPTRLNLPLIAFEAWLQDLASHKGVVCIAPAGNSDSRLPFWPAAFPEIISVGALSTDWRSRAYFSDYGGWVDVYAPGESLVNAFAAGTFTCQIAPFTGQVRTFSGTAQWSGTSFSTPIVTGLIAARMGRCGESAKEAAAALLAKARTQVVPGAGPALFPGCEDDEQCGRCGGDSRHCGCGEGRCGCGHGHRGGCGCGGGPGRARH